MFQLPQYYQDNLKKQFNLPQYLTLCILVNLLQNLKTVRLEEMAKRFPYPIKLRSRIKKLQRFLSLENWKIETIWFPILKSGIINQWESKKVIYLVIDRTQWQNINILMVSLVYNQRAIPIYFTLLDKKGRRYKRNSDFSIGLNAIKWLSEICFFQEQLEELTSLFPQKHSYYRQGMRAISLIQSAL